MKPAADERRVAQGVEIGEDPHAIDDDHGPRFRVLQLGQTHRAGQLEMPQALGNPGEVVGVRLVRRQQQARGGELVQQIGEGRQEDRFI